MNKMPVWLVGAAAAVLAAAGLYGYGVLARALGMSMHAGELGASKAAIVIPIVTYRLRAASVVSSALRKSAASESARI